MAWTAPRTWVALEVPTAAIFNTHVRDNFRELYRLLHSQAFTSNITDNGAWTTSAVTFSGSPIILTLACPFWRGPSAAASQVGAYWQRDSTDVLMAIDAFNNPAANPSAVGPFLETRITAPLSGSHTYGFRNNGLGTGTVWYASANSPAIIRIWEKGGT